MKRLIYLTLILTGGLFVFTNCNKDEDDEPPMGILNGTVTSETGGITIEGAQIDLFLENGDPAGKELITDIDGKYSVELEPGNYSARVYKQSYNSIPPQGVTPIGFSISDDQTTTKDYSMSTSDVVDGGWITGTVKSGESAVSGINVIATQGTNTYAGITNQEGMYTIYNVPAAAYSVKGWKQGFNSPEASATVNANTGTENIDLAVTEDATASLSGSITFLATSNGTVDVTLIDKASRLAIPGLSVMTDGSYTIDGIPDGSYEAIATFKNDTYVVDPDWVAKNNPGALDVNVPGTTQKDFSVTGAVTLTSPTNTYPEATPIEISEMNPTFTWESYSATKGYIFEIQKENGETIWGGMDDAAYGSIKWLDEAHVTSPSYTYPATAPALQVGTVYRWLVYAHSDVNTEGKEHTGVYPTGDLWWQLVSTSEDQMGLIKIVE